MWRGPVRSHQNAEAMRLGAGHHSDHLPAKSSGTPFTPLPFCEQRCHPLKGRNGICEFLCACTSIHMRIRGRAPHRQRENHSGFLRFPRIVKRERSSLQPPGGALERVALRPVRHRRRVPRPPRRVPGDEGAGRNHGRHLSVRREGRKGACWLLCCFYLKLCPLCCLSQCAWWIAAETGPGGAVEGVKGWRRSRNGSGRSRFFACSPMPSALFVEFVRRLHRHGAGRREDFWCSVPTKVLP